MYTYIIVVLYEKIDSIVCEWKNELSRYEEIYYGKSTFRLKFLSLSIAIRRRFTKVKAIYFLFYSVFLSFFLTFFVKLKPFTIYEHVIFLYYIGYVI